MAKAVAAALVAMLILGACGSDEPTNADRPDDVVEPTTIAPEVAGETVEAPTPTAVVLTVEPDALTYTVQSGDTLGLIAQNFGVTVQELAEANGIDDADVISIDQTLVIPEPS